MVHPAAVADTLLRWAGGSGYTGGEAAADPEAVSLLLRAACALWRASPNDSVQARQLEHVRALAALLRSPYRQPKRRRRRSDAAVPPGTSQQICQRQSAYSGRLASMARG